MTALLEIVKNQPVEGFTDKLVYGGQILLIGIATVFAVLILIWGCLAIFKLVFHDIPEKRKVTPALEANVATDTVITPTDNSEEIVAVIAAAIAAAESDSAGLKFKVVSFKRK